MTLFNEADAIFVGDVAADRVYAGANLVWEKEAAGLTYPEARLLAFHNHAGPRADFSGELGFRITMVANRAVNWVGLYKNAVGEGYTGTRKINLYDYDTHELLRTATGDYASAAHTDNYIWLAISPLTLVAGKKYALLMEIAAVGVVFENYGSCAPVPEYATDLYECYAFTIGGAFDGPSAGFQYGGLDLGWNT